jgi:predicted dehydrogenase
VRAEDMATMLLRHRSGATSIVDCSYSTWIKPDNFPQTLVHIEGTRGGVRLIEGYRMLVTSDGETSETDVSAPALPWTIPPWHTAQASVLNTQRHWIECLRNRTAPQTSGEDNLRTYALVVAAYRSAAERRAVAPVI